VSARAPAPSRRCSWAELDPLLGRYHDEEWGVPIRDSRRLWEMLVLEGFQAGLSWLTILRRRDSFRRAFSGFDPGKVARYGTADVERLLSDPGIIRSRAKIDATVAGARAYLELRESAIDFAEYSWGFVKGRPLSGGRQVVAKTPLSEKISADLKSRGFRFVGPVIVYAWMQSVGLVNDHAISCVRRREIRSAE
jgi:DNA-3-methyladenine glycosylase I